MSLIFFLGTSLSAFSQSSTITISPGDNLFRLTLKTGIPVDVLKRMNNLNADAIVFPGQKIIIPQVHKVIRGDTLFSLAKGWNINLSELKKWNGLTGNTISVGQRLYYFVDAVVNSAPSSPEIKDTRPAAISPNNGRAGLFSIKPVTGTPRSIRTPVIGYTFSEVRGNFVSVSDGIIIYQDLTKELGRIMLVETSDGKIVGYSGFESTELTLGAPVRKGQTLGRLGQGESRLVFFAYENGIPLEFQWDNP